MLELAPYGLAALVAILLVAFCFACNDDCASFRDKPSSGLRYDAELRRPKPVEGGTAAAVSDTGPQDQQPDGDLHG